MSWCTDLPVTLLGLSRQLLGGRMIRPAIIIAIVIATVCVLYTFFPGHAQEKRATVPQHGVRPACGKAMGHQHMASAARETPDKPRQDIREHSVFLTLPMV